MWLLTNRKAPERKGKVQLIDATLFWSAMRRSLGDKRREIPPEKALEVLSLLAKRKDGETRTRTEDGYEEEVVVSHIFPTTQFGFRRIPVERPLRLNLQASPERIARLEEQNGFQNLARSPTLPSRPSPRSSIAAFLNTEGGDLLLGVADDRTVVGIEQDRLDNDDKFMLHLSQVVRNGLGARAGTRVDPKVQIVDGKGVCVVSCQRSPEPVLLRWKGVEAAKAGDFFVRSGPGTVRLSDEDAKEYARTRFPQAVDTRD